jgi:hypothetical protein
VAAAGITVVWSAGTASAAPVVRASQDPSPYATPGCVALDASQVAAGSLNYLNSEVEPQVSVDPTNPAHLVGAWQQDRWSDGGAHGLVAGYSTDGGASWHVSPQPFSACYHASGYPGAYLDYQRASDPWVSIGPGTPGSSAAGSTAYSVSISFDQTPYPGDPNATHNAVGAAVSYDGGASWTNVQQLIADPCLVNPVEQPGYACNNPKAYLFNDKESVTADPVHPGVAYAVWDRLVAPPASGPGVQHERAYSGPALVSKTTDYGQHWSTPRIIVGLSSQDQTLGNQIVVDRQTGALYDFFDLIQNASNRQGHRGDSVAFVRSTDGGASWSGPVVVSPLGATGVADPDNIDPTTNTPPAPSRTGDDIPEPAINPVTGQLYVVWQDARSSGNGTDQVVISTSSDRGASWSAPTVLSASTGLPAYDPSVTVNAAGQVAVSYFQWNATIRGNEPTQLFIRHSTSPGSSTAPPAFDAPTAIDGPFDNLAAPFAGGYFLGDYQGLAAAATGFVPFYVKTTCSDGGPATQPSCRAIRSVLPPGDPTPTGKDSTDVYARPGS